MTYPTASATSSGSIGATPTTTNSAPASPYGIAPHTASAQLPRQPSLSARPFQQRGVSSFPPSINEGQELQIYKEVLEPILKYP